MKLSKLLFFALILSLFSAGCTIKSQKMKEAKLRKAKEANENKKDIEELESTANAIFFEPDADTKATVTSYELDNFFNTKPSQRFIIQDPKVLEVYNTGDGHEMYLYLGPDVIPRVYSYLFKVTKIKKDDLDLFLSARNDEDNKVFLVLKKLQVTAVPQSEVEANRTSKQIVHADFVQMTKIPKIKLNDKTEKSEKDSSLAVKESAVEDEKE